MVRYGVSVLCSTSLSPVDDLGSLSIDQIAQLGLSSLQVIYYSEQLFRKGVPYCTPFLRINRRGTPAPGAVSHG
ncbi:hypothetical protein EXD76_05680 [BEV proteobacterium]|nr:hypothetical protein [Candidatus Symbiopectobacterium sp. Chty_BC]